MKLIEILNALFPAGHEVGTFGQLIAGTAQTSSSTVAVLGTTDAAAIGHDIALGLAGRILDIVDQHPGRPIVFLVDTKGQALSRAEELLCLNGSLAHLARCVDLARRQGHVSVALVTGEAVSGGFLSFCHVCTTAVFVARFSHSPAMTGTWQCRAAARNAFSLRHRARYGARTVSRSSQWVFMAIAPASSARFRPPARRRASCAQGLPPGRGVLPSCTGRSYRRSSGIPVPRAPGRTRASRGARPS